MSLSQEQGEAVLAQLGKSFEVTYAAAKRRQEDQEGGVTHGALKLFGADHDAEIDAAVGAIRIIGSTTLGALQRDLPRAVEDDERGDRWIRTAKEAEQAMRQVEGYQADSTIEETLRKTAKASGDQVKAGINTAAGTLAQFAWSALPWWVIAGGVVVGGVVIFVYVRQARALAGAA